VARVFLHIGIEKTGTKSLQAFLAGNESRLNRAGMTYLPLRDAPYFEGNEHGPLVACLLDERPDFVSAGKYRPADIVLGALARDVGRAGRDVILSCEQFSSRLTSEAPLRRLAAALDGHEVRIIAYLRRQDDLAIAAYSTAVRSGRRTKFDPAEVLSGSWYFDFGAMLRLWASVFGTEALVVRNYDVARLEGGDIRTDFLGVLGIADRSGFVPGQDHNISLDARQIEAMRILNECLPAFDGPDRSDFDRANLIRTLVEQHLPRGGSVKALLPAEERRRIVEHFAAANHAVETNFMSPGALESWFQPIEPAPAAEATELEARELAAIIAAVASRLADTTAEMQEMQRALARPSRKRALLTLVRSFRGA